MVIILLPLLPGILTKYKESRPSMPSWARCGWVHRRVTWGVKEFIWAAREFAPGAHSSSPANRNHRILSLIPNIYRIISRVDSATAYAIQRLPFNSVAGYRYRTTVRLKEIPLIKFKLGVPPWDTAIPRNRASH